MNKVFFLLGFLLMAHTAQGQEDYLISGKTFVELQKEDHKILQIESTSFSFLPLLLPKPDSNSNQLSLKQQLLNPYAVEDLAFFCRLEVKIEKKLRMPFKFRLGEVQYTERMEGKY
jgi:hypothetical protein